LNILVTGGSGFIGKAVLKKLLENKDSKIIAGIRSSSSIDQALLSNGNLFIREIWDSKINWPRDFAIDIVIHCAAKNDASENNKSLYEEYRLVNTVATIELAKAAALNGVKRFVYISSAKVCGRNNSSVKYITEEDDPNPMDIYSITKLEAEQGLLALKSEDINMELVIIRPPLVYGVGVKGSFDLMIKWINKGVPLPFFRIDNRRSFISLTNLVNFIDLCSKVQLPCNASNQVFFISDDENISTSELIERIAASLGIKLYLFWVPKILLSIVFKILGKSNQVENLYYSAPLDISKAKKLGWRPENKMQHELNAMIKSKII